MSRSIVLAIDVAAGADTVSSALTTTKGLAAFWTPSVNGSTEVGGVLSFGFAEAPVDLAMTVTGSDANRVTWHCDGPWPGWAGTDVSWTMAPSDNGTMVVFHHDGWADDVDDPTVGSVALTWAMVLQALKAYAETGQAATALT